MQKRPTVGVGGVAIPYNQISEQDLDELASYNPILTYGQAKQAPPEEFVPAYVAFDKKVRHVLCLFLYFCCEISFKHKLNMLTVTNILKPTSECYREKYFA